MDPINLLPTPESLSISDLSHEGHAIVITVVTTPEACVCPSCGVLCTRVHSRYHRSLADLPWADNSVRLELGVRRFFCDDKGCERRIFTERLPDLAAVSARRTLRLEAALRVIGLALGGEAGARVARKLYMETSPDTVIRLVLATPTLEAAAPRVLGMDDWAWCKGKRYGTILVDLERHRVLDILPVHTADALVAWLGQHAGIEVIARDRGGVCTDGARRGAPEAVQVADRWHLLSNLTDTVKRLVDRRWHVMKGHLVEAARDVAPAPVIAPEPTPPRPKPPTAVERISNERRERRVARFEEVRRLHLAGLGVREVARILGMHRRTVRKFLRAELFPELAARAKGPTLLTPYLAYLHERWDAGCHNGMQLWRELRARGYSGSRSFVSYWVAIERKTLPPAPKSMPKVKLVRPKRTRTPTMRKVVWGLVRPACELNEKEQLAVARWCAACPQIAAAYALAQSFGRLIRGHEAPDLTVWLEAAEASGVIEMSGLASGIRRDFAAVEGALISRWSTGQVEGQNHRLKLLKRQMYGRAGFELLRKRVLNSA